jgi:hypothetical protein
MLYTGNSVLLGLLKRTCYGGLGMGDTRNAYRILAEIRSSSFDDDVEVRQLLQLKGV